MDSYGKRILVDRLRKYAREGAVTLLFSAKDIEHNNAVVLREAVVMKTKQDSRTSTKEIP